MGAEIPPNQALTGEIDLGSNKLFAIEFPSTWAGTSITFQAKTQGQPAAGDTSPDDLETWKNVYDDAGTEVTVTCAANRIVGLDATALELSSLRWIRIRSGTSASPVNQNPAKPLKLIVKG